MDTPQDPVTQPKQPKSKKKLTLVIVLVVVAVLLLCLGSVLFYFLVINKSTSLFSQQDEEEDAGDMEDGEDLDIDEVEDAEEEEEEEEDEPELPDTATHNNPTVGIQFEYQVDWTVTDDCMTRGVAGDCYIELKKNNYIWYFDFDPFVTGGGFGFNPADLPDMTVSTISDITPGRYTVKMVNGFITSADANQLFGGQYTISSEDDVWVNSISYTDENNLTQIGFGPGAMYDSVLGNFYNIMYSYDTGGDYAQLRLKSDPELQRMLSEMDDISDSVVLN